MAQLIIRTDSHEIICPSGACLFVELSVSRSFLTLYLLSLHSHIRKIVLRSARGK